MSGDRRRLLVSLVKWQDMLHDILRRDALSQSRSMGWMHGGMSNLVGFHELLGVLPDLSRVGAEREPQTDEV